MLSDVDLRAALESGELVVDPIEPHQVQPASIDLRLGDTFKWLPAVDSIFPAYIDPLAAPLEEYETKTVPAGEQFPVPPGGLVLASTVETVKMGASLSAEVAGKSSLGRLFLTVHQTAGHVDPGFGGGIVLEVINNYRDRWFMLTPGMLICQLLVFRLSSPCAIPYGDKRMRSRYQGQTGPTPSRSHLRVK